MKLAYYSMIGASVQLMDVTLAPALTLPPAVFDCSSIGWERLVRDGWEEFLRHSNRCGKSVFVRLLWWMVLGMDFDMNLDMSLNLDFIELGSIEH